MQFKDLFSQQSVDYAKFRPTYPQELFSYLASLAPEKKTAWDCGTGNGQAALELTAYFEKILATDPSEKQIQNAIAHPQIVYSVSAAEKSPQIPTATVDLTTVAQAFHWFHQAQFLQEVRRVSKKNAVLAIWCYELAQISPAVDQAVLVLYEEILGPYWDSQRKLVDEGYKNVQLPLEEIKTPSFGIEATWNLEHLIGYLGTWSALQKYIEKNKKNPIELVFEDLKKSWGPEITQTVKWKLGLRVWRV